MLYNFRHNLEKINYFNTFNFFILSSLLYTSFVVYYLSYDIVQSPDFEKYTQYLFFYDGQLDTTGLEQGNLYFYLAYSISYFVTKLIPVITTNEILNISIHLTNLILIFFAFVGLFKYLVIKGFQKKNIYLALISIVFLPQLNVLRLSFKPELLAFTFLTWLFYLLEKYKATKVDFYLYQFSILLALLSTSKVSIVVMVGVLLLFEIVSNHRYLFSKKYLRVYFLFFLCFSVLSVENYLFNDKLITQVEHDEQYNNKAGAEFFTTFSKEDLIDNPNRDFFSDSFLGIILLDNFGDFFKLYWESEYTELNNERLDFFTVNDTNNYNSIPTISFDKSTSIWRISANVGTRHSDKNHENESRIRLGLYTTIVFYLFVFISLFIKFKSKTKVLIISPLIGIFIVALSASGIFGNNFDPQVGDSLKTFYYAFFVVLSFCVLICQIFEKFNVPKKTIIILILLMQLFVIGFPQNYSQTTLEDMHYKNSIIPLCEFNNLYIWDIFNAQSQNDCNHESFEFSYDSNKERFAPLTEVKAISFESPFKNLPIANVSLFLSLGLIPWLFRKKSKRVDYE